MPADLEANTEDVDIPFNDEEVFRSEEDRELERDKLSNWSLLELRSLIVFFTVDSSAESDICRLKVVLGFSNLLSSSLEDSDEDSRLLEVDSNEELMRVEVLILELSIIY